MVGMPCRSAIVKRSRSLALPYYYTIRYFCSFEVLSSGKEWELTSGNNVLLVSQTSSALFVNSTIKNISKSTYRNLEQIKFI
jgi:fucose 4-O-acetylase-like acetyltransferase